MLLKAFVKSIKLLLWLDFCPLQVPSRRREITGDLWRNVLSGSQIVVCPGNVCPRGTALFIDQQFFLYDSRYDA